MDKRTGVVLLCLIILAGVLFVMAKHSAQNYSTIDVVIATPTPMWWIPGGPGSGGTTSTPAPTLDTPLELSFYWDNETTNPVSELDWGTISPGGESQKLVYLKNVGEASLTILHVTVNNLVCKDVSQSNLIGDYTQYFSISLDCVGSRLAPQEVIQGIFTLQIEENIIDVHTFSFQVTVTISQ